MIFFDVIVDLKNSFDSSFTLLLKSYKYHSSQDNTVIICFAYCNFEYIGILNNNGIAIFKPNGVFDI